MKKRAISLLLVVCLAAALRGPAAAAAVKLPTPEVEWLTEEKMVGTYRFQPGTAVMTNIPENLPYYEIVIRYENGQVFEEYTDGFGGEKTSVQRLAIGYYTENEMPSGTYTLTARYLGDDVTYTDSEAVTVSYEYVDPGVSFSVPTDIRWEDNSFHYTLGDDVDPNQGASLFFEFAFLREDGSTANHRYRSLAIGQSQERLLERFNELVDRNGPGNYKFRVRVTSSNLEACQFSAWSQWSEPFYISGISEDTMGTLESIYDSLPVDGILSGEQKQTAVDRVRNEIDRDALTTELAADHDGTGAAGKLAELEERLDLTARVEVDPDAGYTLDPLQVRAVGAGLNAESMDTPPTLRFSKPDAEREIPNTYQNDVQMELTLENAAASPDGSFPVPIRITMPVPDGIDHTRLRILHFRSDGSSESLTPYCFQENGVWMVSFTVNHLSPIVFAQFEPFVITFNPSGGTVEPAFAETGEDGRLESLPQPERSGFRFVGWFTEETGGEQVGEEKAYAENTELFARWEAVEQTETPSTQTGPGILWRYRGDGRRRNSVRPAPDSVPGRCSDHHGGARRGVRAGQPAGGGQPRPGGGTA